MATLGLQCRAHVVEDPLELGEIGVEKYSLGRSDAHLRSPLPVVPSASDLHFSPAFAIKLDYYQACVALCESIVSTVPRTQLQH